MSEEAQPESGGKLWEVRLNLLKSGVQVVAILVGAWWTYHLFVVKEKPLLEELGDASADITWELHSDTSCEIDHVARLKNVGQSSFRVTKVVVRGWHVRLTEVTEGAPLYLDPLLFEAREPFFHREFGSEDYPRSPFIRSHPPKAESTQGFRFRWSRQESEMLYFRVEYFAEIEGGGGSGAQTPTWWTGWLATNVCTASPAPATQG